jgi:pimeloyl-ACP methyl ester carboxylesterase
LIRRRHVFYVEGYDPQGAEGYYKLFERSWKRFLTIWPLASKLGPLEIESEEFAHWNIEAAGPNWQVATRYEFLRQEHIIRANMAEPMTRQIPRALGWALDYLVSGALVRVFRASWEFGIVLMSFQAMITWWLLLSVGGGWLIGYLAAQYFGLPVLAGLIVGIAGAFAIFALLRLLANRWFAIQINSHWPYLCEFARGEPSCFDRPIDACVERLIAAARANAVDEIVVVGHSGGGALAPVVLARALERDPDLGRRGPPIVLLTLGSIMPGAALHPKAVQLHTVVARLAVEPSISWIDCQSRKDVMNFWDFDPVAGIGVRVDAARCNPLVWKLRFREMLSPEFYKRLRLNFFRMHYQFIMANDRRAPYDYFMLMCGPLPVATWARSYGAVMAAFAEDASLAKDRVTLASDRELTGQQTRSAPSPIGRGVG